MGPTCGNACACVGPTHGDAHPHMATIPAEEGLSVDFPNKGMELIGLQNMFAHRKLNRIIPLEAKEKIKPVSVVYKYEAPFSRRLRNY